MSAVCDEQPDCLYGEDDSFCVAGICHDALKCRGESKCIGWDQVRNGNIDCTCSYDDYLDVLSVQKIVNVTVLYYIVM